MYGSSASTLSQPPLLPIYKNDKPTLTSDDVEIPNCPSHMISSLSWSEARGRLVLCATAWDGTASAWDVEPQPDASTGRTVNNLNVTPISQHRSPSGYPVLCSTVSPEGVLYFGTCDRGVWAETLGGSESGGGPQQVAEHSQPVKSIAWIDEIGVLATGSWDCTTRFWDTRQQQPLAEVNCGAPVQDMDFSTAPLVTILCARKTILYDLQSRNVMQEIQPYHAVRHQLRCIANFKDQTGFAAGSVDGRIMVHYYADQGNTPPPPGKKSFSFRAHRAEINSSSGQPNSVFPVNGVSCHPLGTLLSVGGNGSVTTWDKESQDILQDFKVGYLPLSASALNSAGTLFAFASSYDWSRGPEHYRTDRSSRLTVKMLKPAHVQPKNRNTASS